MVQLQGLVMNPSETGNFISPKKNNQNSGFRIKFQWVAGWGHVHSFGFCFTKGYHQRSLGTFFAIGRNAIQEAQLYSNLHPRQAISCEICQIKIDTCFSFVYIYYYIPIIHTFLIRKQIQNNCTLFVYLLYTSDQYVRVQISPLIFIFLCTDTE